MTKSIRVGTSPSKGTEESFFTDALKDTGNVGARSHLYGATAAYCPRQNFFLAHEWPEDESEWSATSQIYMGIGSGVEEAIAKGLGRKNKLLFNNLYVPGMVPVVRGKIDFVYVDQDENIAIAELKTCGNLPIKPKESHLSQLSTYSAVSGYDTCKLIYVSRNVADPASGFQNLLIRVFPIEFSREDHVNTLTRICLSQLAIDRGFMPSIPSNFRKSIHCGYCAWKSVCWGDREVEFPELGFADEKAVTEEARAMAEKLTDERPLRLVKSLRHVYRNVGNWALQTRVIEEIERYESF
jgi:CRISPR/Cas system-associated exonuclease Cas4 (RecB family)